MFKTVTHQTLPERFNRLSPPPSMRFQLCLFSKRGEQSSIFLPLHRVSKIAPTADGSKIELVFEGSRELGTFDHVISTATFGALRGVDTRECNLSYNKQLAMRTLHYDNAVKVRSSRSNKETYVVESTMTSHGSLSERAPQNKAKQRPRNERQLTHSGLDLHKDTKYEMIRK